MAESSDLLTTSEPALEIDYDCDFLMDCDGDDGEGLREVLHMLCSTPRVLPTSPRQHTPRKIVALPGIGSLGAGGLASPAKITLPVPSIINVSTAAVASSERNSPERQAVDESNLKYLSQFQDPGLNQLLTVLSSPVKDSPIPIIPPLPLLSSRLKPHTTITAPLAAAMALSLSPLDTQSKLKGNITPPPAPPGEVRSSEAESNAKKVVVSAGKSLGRKRSLVESQAQALKELSLRDRSDPRGLGAIGVRRDYDIDLTADSVSMQTSRARLQPRLPHTLLRGCEGAEIIAPLATLLRAQPSLAQVSVPLPCPFDSSALALGGGTHSPPTQTQTSEMSGSGEDAGSDVDDVSKDDSSEADRAAGRTCLSGGSRSDKSLYSLCRKFIARCRQLGSECGPLAGRSEGVEVNLSELTSHLQVKQRRVHDIVNILSAVTVLLPERRSGRGLYVFRELKATEQFLGMLQDGAVVRHRAQALIAGLLTAEDLAIVEAASSSSDGARLQRPNPLVRIPSKPRVKLPVQESLCLGLVGLFLAGFGVLSLQEAAQHLPSLCADETRVRDAAVLDATKMKRLYDVANTLCGAGLLRKEEVPEALKPQAGVLSSTSFSSSLRGSKVVIVYKWGYVKSPLKLRQDFLMVNSSSDRTTQQSVQHRQSDSDFSTALTAL